LHTQLGSAPAVPCTHDADWGALHEILQLLPESPVALHELVAPPALFVSGEFAGWHAESGTSSARSQFLNRIIRAFRNPLAGLVQYGCLRPLR
jgi:hypothetical protein